ncbi:M3 family oligoendopeptidase [Salmonella enterica]|nr:M3 family oligoendopeptidase [Salmonella enterica]
MFSFICEWIIEADCSSTEEQNKLYEIFDDLIKIRNEIAHGSDQNEKSNIAIRQLTTLSNVMLSRVNFRL